MPRTIQDAKPIIEGREVWVCGSGPTLDAVAFKGEPCMGVERCPDDATVVAINGTLEALRPHLGVQALAWIAMDPQEVRRRRGWPENVQHVFLSAQSWDKAVGTLGWTRDVAEAAYVFDQEVARAPGSVTAVVDICGQLKARRVVLAGIGGTGFSSRAIASPNYQREFKQLDEFWYDQQHQGALGKLWHHRLLYRHVGDNKWVQPNG